MSNLQQRRGATVPLPPHHLSCRRSCRLLRTCCRLQSLAIFVGYYLAPSSFLRRGGVSGPGARAPPRTPTIIKKLRQGRRVARGPHVSARATNKLLVHRALLLFHHRRRRLLFLVFSPSRVGSLRLVSQPASRLLDVPAGGRPPTPSSGTSEEEEEEDEQVASWQRPPAMEKRKRVLELRDRLDRTLALPDLADESSLRALVKKQILASSLTGSNEGDIDLIAETRAREVSEFLDMLNTSRDGRSSKVHGAPQKEWKVKQDTDQLRVMYREGPEGTPFHTLLLEGFADGPIDVCTCVSWEPSLYKKWFPQYNLPTFRIDQSGCLKKVRIGEEICLVRMKVPWPVSEREALLHYFEFEYLKEDIVIVIMKTISDLDSINIRTHGFSRDGIPEAGDTVRIDVFGGFVLQRISKEKSFFRAIANMDIKLDFVPPWLINFISRQLIGSGHKLYQKAVSTVATCDEDYKRALRGPLYTRIREYQGSDDKSKVTTTAENAATEVPPDNSTVQNRFAVTNTTANSEIVEEESEQNMSKVDSLPTSPPYQPAERAQQVDIKPFISPEVERALGILDTAIAVLRGDKTTNITTLQNLLSYDTTLEDSTVSSRSSLASIRNADNLLNGGPATTQPHDSREIRQAYSLPGEKASDRAEDATDKDSPKNSTASTVTKTMSMTLRSAIRVHGEESLDTNGFHQNGFGNNKEPKRGRKTKRWPCCLTPTTI